MQSKQFIGTCFDLSVSFKHEKIAYAIWQKERCPTSGKEHLQFFMILMRKTRFLGLKDIIGTAHVEVAKDVEKSIAYCSKEETRLEGPWEYGLRPRCKEAMTDALRKRKICDILMEQPNLWRNVRQMQACKAAVTLPRSQAPKVAVLLSGPTGTGKTTYAMRLGQFVGDVYYKTGTKWWDGYEGNEMVIWDEFRDTQVEAHYLLSLINQTPFKAEIKGGTVEIDSAIFIFTSNVRLDDMYMSLDFKTRDALKRRIIEIYIP
nr:MAG: replication associated protein [Cressdnaviricota sp.]